MVRISSRRSSASRSRRAGRRRNSRRSSAGDSGGIGTGARNRSGPGSGYRQVTSSAPVSAASASAVITSSIAGSRNVVPAGGQVLLEVVEDHQQPQAAQQAGDRGQLRARHRCRDRSSSARHGAQDIGLARVGDSGQRRRRWRWAVAAIRAVGFHRPSCTAISQPSSRSRDDHPPGQRRSCRSRRSRSASPRWPPRTARPLAAVRRSTPIAVRIWARRPISVAHRQVPHQLAARRRRRRRQRHLPGRRVDQRPVRARGQQRRPPRTPAAAAGPCSRCDRSSSAR